VTGDQGGYEEHVELVPVTQVGTEGEASMVIGQLESEGIRAMANPPLGTPGARGWQQRVVLVRPQDADRAREILAGDG
jgi:hypothetical protein